MSGYARVPHMTPDEVRAEAKLWTFKMPGYSWHIDVEEPGEERYSFARIPAAVLTITVTTQDSTGEIHADPGTFHVVHSYRRPLHMIPNAEVFAEWLRHSVQTTVVHEAMEWIRRDNVMMFNPHQVPF